MKLPNAELAQAEQSKIVDYLLSLKHEEGRAKARFFHQLGFSADAWQDFAAALLAHALSNRVVSNVDTEYGKKYCVDGPLTCPDGRTARIRAIWIIDAGATTPRLVTAYPTP